VTRIRHIAVPRIVHDLKSRFPFACSNHRAIALDLEDGLRTLVLLVQLCVSPHKSLVPRPQRRLVK